MQHSEAKALLMTLVAAFRPRDWGEASQELYVREFAHFDFAVGQDAIEELIHTTDYMPSIRLLSDTLVDTHRVMRPTRLSMPEWTEQDEAKAKALAQEFYGEHPFQLPEHKPVVFEPRTIEVDEEDVARKREAARKAKEKLLAEQDQDEP